MDLHKAFDSCHWQFIKDVLILRGYPLHFINWIHSCISSARFTVQINGEPCGYFSSTRGIRQGTPFPLIFLCSLWMSSLSYWIKRDISLNFLCIKIWKQLVLIIFVLQMILCFSAKVRKSPFLSLWTCWTYSLPFQVLKPTRRKAYAFYQILLLTSNSESLISTVSVRDPCQQNFLGFL